MKVDTEFEVGDTVYFIKDRMVIGEAQIEKIIVESQSLHPTIEYIIRERAHAHTDRRAEVHLFDSKEHIKNIMKADIDKL